MLVSEDSSIKQECLFFLDRRGPFGMALKDQRGVTETAVSIQNFSTSKSWFQQ